MPSSTAATAGRTVAAPAAEPGRSAGIAGLGAVYASLTKAKLSALVLWTTAVGFLLGLEDAFAFNPGRFAAALVGSALAAACANGLNQVIEVRRDRLMDRTRERPLPAGQISLLHAIVFCIAAGILGVGILRLFVNELSAALALFTILLYVGVYTPLKPVTTLNTLVGAVCGAVPPMIGWAAAAGDLSAGAWVLGALLFVWQLPHFLALAWMYRDDYARGGFAMLPVKDPDGRVTTQVVVLTSLMLLPIMLIAALLDMTGWVATIGSTMLGAWMLWLAVRFHLSRDRQSARRVFLASIVYLSIVMVLLVADQGSGYHAAPTIHGVQFASGGEFPY